MKMQLTNTILLFHDHMHMITIVLIGAMTMWIKFAKRRINLLSI